MQLQSQKKTQHCENEIRFLQARERRKASSTRETILVGLRCQDDSAGLLLWAINAATAPGDSVVALQLNLSESKVDNGTVKSQELDVWCSQKQPLKELCKAKQIHLEFDFALTGNEELELIHGAAAVLATLIVISPPSHHVVWNFERKGNSLAQKAPAGCSIVIVKDHKLLFYKETGLNKFESRASSDSESPHLYTSYQRSKGLYTPLGSFQRHFSCTSSPLWGREVNDEAEHSSEGGSELWTTQMELSSPRGVLDLFDSASSSSSPASYGSLPSSGPLRGFFSCLLLEDDVDSLKTDRCFGLWKAGFFSQSLLFSPSRCLKKFHRPLEYAVMRNSFKSYVNSLWGTESMRHDSPMTASQKQKWRCFPYEELAFATRNFNSDNLIARGGHADVYKGRLPDGQDVAIKRLRKDRSQEVAERDFLTELGIIGHVDHPNATPLVGFCVEQGLHLIFRFSSNGSVATWLHGENSSLLEWADRYKIAVGTAQGLDYLHTACPHRIIHRDIKASNILLGPEFQPQISDFGLAKWLPEQWCQLNVFPVEGTFGYLAPEYFRYGIIHEKTDIFAFGVLLLELITGRLPIDDTQQSLVIWAKPLLESSRIEELADPRLNGAYNHKEMRTLVLVAALCVQSSAVSRPFIGQILELLMIRDHSESFSMSFLSDYTYDSSEEYYSALCRSDLSRHREIALQFEGET